MSLTLSSELFPLSLHLVNAFSAEADWIPIDLRSAVLSLVFPAVFFAPTVASVTLVIG